MKKSHNKANSGPLTIGNILILFLGVLAGLIHLFQPDTLLKLNGLGYLVLAAGTVFKLKGAEALQEVAPKMLIVYALTTISMFFVLNGELATEHTLGLVTKVVELWLVVVLFNEQRTQKKARKVWVPQSSHHLMSKGESW